MYFQVTAPSRDDLNCLSFIDDRHRSLWNPFSPRSPGDPGGHSQAAQAFDEFFFLFLQALLQGTSPPSAAKAKEVALRFDVSLNEAHECNTHWAHAVLRAILSLQCSPLSYIWCSCPLHLPCHADSILGDLPVFVDLAHSLLRRGPKGAAVPPTSPFHGERQQPTLMAPNAPSQWAAPSHLHGRQRKDFKSNMRHHLRHRDRDSEPPTPKRPRLG